MEQGKGKRGEGKQGKVSEAKASEARLRGKSKRRTTIIIIQTFTIVFQEQ